MLLIIFGAGASHDSYAPSRPPPGVKATSPARNRPPLADGLFSEGAWGPEIQGHPECAVLFSRLRAASSIEEELESMHDEAERYSHIARAMFELRAYLREVVDTSSREWFNSYTRGVTNYVTLLDGVEMWRQDNNETVCLVTFNYDTLLDDACSNILGLKFADMASYVAYSSYKLFKLHGSVNWYRLVSNVPGPFSASLPGLQWTDTYTLDTRTPPPGPTEDYVPAIAVPTIAKSSFECPPSHLEALKSALPNVTHLLVIGWRGMEEHFLSLWANTARKPLQLIQIVSGSDTGSTIVKQKLEPFRIETTGVRRTTGFSQFVTQAELKNFLRAL